MSIILLLCVFIKRPPGWGWGHIQLRPWVVKVIAVAPSPSCQNRSAAMYILVSNRLQPGGSLACNIGSKCTTRAACSSPKGSDSDCKEKNVGRSPFAPIQGPGAQSEILPESEIWKRAAVRNLFLPLPRGSWQSRWTIRIRGGLFTRAPECRLNGLEMDLSQIRAVARGLKRGQLGGVEKGFLIKKPNANLFLSQKTELVLTL